MTHDWSKALARQESAAPKPEETQSPDTWRPNRKDYEEIETRVVGEHMRSVPMNYESLREFTGYQLDQIERTAMIDLRRAMDHQGLTPDERTLKPHWQLVVEGYGFRMPPGYIHPESPPEESKRMRETWKRCVDGAADSLYKAIHLTVWRRRRALPAPATDGPHQIEPGGGQVGDWVCRPCNEAFPTEQAFNAHVDTKHAPQEGFEIRAVGN